jgi:hyaluronan synthase
VLFRSLFSRLAIEADPRAQVATVLVSTAVSSLKCVYFAARAKDIKAFYFVLYTYVYFFAMIPARITAMLTMFDIGWGTRGGNGKLSIGARMWLWTKQYAIAYIWWALVLAAGIYSIQHNWYFDWDSLAYRFALIGIASYAGFIAIVLFVFFIGKITTWNFTKLQKNFIEDRMLHDAAAAV